MKKNKTVAYMLAATLLVGGTFLGTKALFTDNINVAGELAISTGDVDIEIIEGDNKWTLDRNGNEYTGDGTTKNTINDEASTTNDRVNIEHDNTQNQVEVGAGTFANNLKPGDRLYKTIKIQNQGTLVADVTLGDNFGTGESSKLGNLAGLITPSKTVYKNNEAANAIGENFKLNPGETATITLELNVNTGTDYQHQPGGTAGTDFNSDNQENYVANLNGAWTLDAQQLTESTDGDEGTSQPGK